jgi:hypothetical protein
VRGVKSKTFEHIYFGESFPIATAINSKTGQGRYSSKVLLRHEGFVRS